MAILILLGILMFSPQAWCQEGHEYAVTQKGNPIGVLRVVWDGSRTLEGIFRDPKGLVLFQDRFDGTTDEAARDDQGVITRTSYKVDKKTIPFDLNRIHVLFLLKSKFPIKNGEVRQFKMVDPETKTTFDAEVERAGFKIINSAKFLHYLLDARGTRIDLYVDQNSNLIRIDIPSTETSYQTNDVVPASYPMDVWEPRRESPCCSLQPIEIQSATGHLLKGSLIFPMKGSRYPGALIFGTERSREGLLVPLGYQLAARRAAVIVATLDPGTSPDDRMMDVDTLFRFLRRQDGVAPGQMFAIGYDAGAQDAMALWKKRHDLSAVVLVSPQAGIEGALDSLLFDFKNAETSVLILQGENDALSSLEAMHAWSKRANAGLQSPRATWQLVRGMGHDFLPEGDVALKFHENIAERSPDKSLFSTLTGWLLGRGLVQAVTAKSPTAPPGDL